MNRPMRQLAERRPRLSIRKKAFGVQMKLLFPLRSNDVPPSRSTGNPEVAHERRP
jgi:hypothetical protein